MARRLSLALTALVMPLCAASAGAAHVERTVSFRVILPPANLGFTTVCRDGETRSAIVSATGRRIGTSHVCVLEARKRDRPGYAVAAAYTRVIQTDTLRGGAIVSRASYAYRFNRRGTVSHMTMNGRVVSGSGRYAGARGPISGRGVARIAAELHPRYTFLIRLR